MLLGTRPEGVQIPSNDTSEDSSEDEALVNEPGGENKIISRQGRPSL